MSPSVPQACLLGESIETESVPTQPGCLGLHEGVLAAPIHTSCCLPFQCDRPADQCLLVHMADGPRISQCGACKTAQLPLKSHKKGVPSITVTLSMRA